jgi:hypothetical protein
MMKYWIENLMSPYLVMVIGSVGLLIPQIYPIVFTIERGVVHKI